MFSKDNQPLAIGTGFIYEDNDCLYLVTNGHNITRVNPETQVRITRYVEIPDYIILKFPIKKKI